MLGRSLARAGTKPYSPARGRWDQQMSQADKRRPFEERARGGLPASAPKSAIERLIDFLDRHRTRVRQAGLAASGLILAGSAVIFVRTLLLIDVKKFELALAATGLDQIALAFGFAALSYLALTGYDGLALKHLQIKVPYRLTALASFTSYAVSFTLGFPLVTGGAVRYWIYGPAGLSAGKVASLTVVAGVTFWLGMGFIVAAGFIAEAGSVADIDHLNPVANQLIGLAVCAALVVYLVWLARMRRRDKPIFRNFKLPGPLLTLGQMGLGVIDVCSAAASLYVLLPKGADVPYPTFATLYSVACMLGIASHSPGGLGVFEATILKGVGGSSDAILASLLLFRGVYYVVPFIGAMALLGGNEAIRRWRSLREAMAAPDDE